MRNWLNRAERHGATVLWSCLACGGGGQFIDDDQGRADHAGEVRAPARGGQAVVPRSWDWPA